MKEEIAGTNLTPITEFVQSALALADLQSRYKGLVVQVDTPKGMKDAKAATFELRTLRTSLEKKRKDLKAPIIERGKLLDDEAKRLTAEIVALEEPIDVQIKAHEAKIQAEFLAKQEADRARIEAITTQIRALRDTAGTLVGKPSSIINGALNRLEGTVLVEAELAEYYAEARDALDAAKARVRELLHVQKEQEAEQARIKADREELERIRAENERMQREADELAEADRVEQVRLSNIAAAEEQARRDAEQAARDEASRIEREAQEAADRTRREQEEAVLQAERERQAAEQRKLDEQAAKLKREQQAAKAEAERVRLAGLGLREAAQAVVDQLGEEGIQCVEELAVALANDAAPAKPARAKRGEK